MPGIVCASLRLLVSCPLCGVRFIYLYHETNVRVVPIALSNRKAPMQAHDMCDHLHPCRASALVDYSLARGIEVSSGLSRSHGVFVPDA